MIGHEVVLDRSRKLLRDELVAERTDALDLHLDGVAVAYRADARRGSRRDHVAG